MLRNVLLALVVCVFGTSTGQAADLTALRAVFTARFDSGWVDGRCGENTLGLVAEARRQGIDLTRSIVVHAQDFYGDFGLIAGYRARQGGALVRPEPISGPASLPGRRNWYFHVFLVAEETVHPGRLGEVAVFDLSFENEPTVLGLAEYLDRMFQPEDSARDLRARKKHLFHFYFDLYDGDRAPEPRRTNPPLLRERVYLRDLWPAYFEQKAPIESDFLRL